MVERGPILEFRGQYRFLSSFYDGEEAGFRLEAPRLYGSPLGAWIVGMSEPPWCPTREHGYQALKCRTLDDALWVLQSESAGQAKRRASAKGEDGVRIKLIDGWGHLSLAAMLHCARLQFMPPGGMRDQLTATGYRPLVEGNTWGDMRWGAVWVSTTGVEALREGGHAGRPWGRRDAEPQDGSGAELLFGENLLGRCLMRARAELGYEVLL